MECIAGALAATSMPGISFMPEESEDILDMSCPGVFMPGIDGVTLIKSLRKRNPRFPVIAMSGVLLGAGRTALDHLPNIADLSDVICLQKPFRPHELLAAVAAALPAAAQV